VDGSPRDPVELALVRAWERCLGVERVKVDDDFRACGGTKAASVAIGELLRERLGVWLPPSAFGSFPRLEQLAAIYRPLVPPERFAEPIAFNHDGEPSADAHAREVFVVHGVGGEVVSAYGLASRLPATWRAWGLELASLRTGDHVPFDIPTLAARHIATIRRVRREGPIVLAGHSLGGVVAYEMARQLAHGELTVSLLLLFDVEVPQPDPRRPAAYAQPEREALLDRMCRAGFFPPGSTVDLLDRFTRITEDMQDAVADYAIEPCALRAVHFRTAGYESDPIGERSSWEPYLGAGVRTEAIGGDHYTMYASPHVEGFAALVTERLADVADPAGAAAPAG
jgi:thioesterase domain-containing protein